VREVWVGVADGGGGGAGGGGKVSEGDGHACAIRNLENVCVSA
jgi:hypothetical protein